MNRKGVGETLVSPWRKVGKTEGFPGVLVLSCAQKQNVQVFLGLFVFVGMDLNGRGSGNGSSPWRKASENRGFPRCSSPLLHTKN